MMGLASSDSEKQKQRGNADEALTESSPSLDGVALSTSTASSEVDTADAASGTRGQKRHLTRVARPWHNTGNAIRPGAVAVEGFASGSTPDNEMHEEYSQEFAVEPSHAVLRDDREGVRTASLTMTESYAEAPSPITAFVSTDYIEHAVRARILEESVVASTVENVPTDLVKNQQESGSNSPTGVKSDTMKNPWSLRSWRCLAVAAVIVVALVGGILGGTMSGTNSSTSTRAAPASSPAPSESALQQKLLDFLASFSLDNGTSLNDATSPQHSAYTYMIEVDMHRTNATFDRDVLQIYSLATFYFSTNGPKAWKKSDGWLEAPDIAHPCTWHGVLCDEYVGAPAAPDGDRVRRLARDWEASRLFGANLRRNLQLGEERAAFANLLSMLERMQTLSQSFTVVGLSLPNNGLDGFGLIELAYLTTVVSIDMSGNNFNGQELSLDAVLLSDLKYVNVSNSNFGGDIASLEFMSSTLSQLEIADISQNNVSGTLPAELGDMPNLRVLVAEQNPLLAGSVPEKLCQLDSISRVTVDCDLLSCSCCTPHCVSNATNP
jgi:Leucine-rich repeat (LRR) protein